MPGIITSANLDDLRVQFEARFQDALQTTPTWWQMIATEIPSSAESNLYGFIENELDIREWVGERELRTVQEQDYRLTNRHWEGTVALNRDKISDDTLGLFSRVTVPMFGSRVAKWHDRQLADFFLNNVNAFDGQPFFDPNNNNSGTDALGADGVAFAAARAAIKSQKDPLGQPRYVGDEFVLVVPPQLERIARTIVDAEWGSIGVVTEGIHQATNVQKGLAKVLVIEELSVNDNRWFLLATGLPIKPFLVQTREGPDFVAKDNKQRDEQPFSKNENVYGVDFRSAYGVSFPFLAFANDPDGAMS